MDNFTIYLGGSTVDQFNAMQKKLTDNNKIWLIHSERNNGSPFIEINGDAIKRVEAADPLIPLITTKDYLMEEVEAKRLNTGKIELSHLIDFLPVFKKLYEVNGGFDLENLIDDGFEPLPDYIISIMTKLEESLGGPIIIHEKFNSMYDLIRLYPDAINEFCKVCTNGALKYDRGNFKKGFAEYTLIDSAMRHYTAWCRGIMFDVPDDDPEIYNEYFNGDKDAYVAQFSTHHLAHVMWNLMVKLSEDKDR